MSSAGRLDHLLSSFLTLICSSLSLHLLTLAGFFFFLGKVMLDGAAGTPAGFSSLLNFLDMTFFLVARSWTANSISVKVAYLEHFLSQSFWMPSWKSEISKTCTEIKACVLSSVSTSFDQWCCKFVAGHNVFIWVKPKGGWVWLQLIDLVWKLLQKPAAKALVGFPMGPTGVSNNSVPEI